MATLQLTNQAQLNKGLPREQHQPLHRTSTIWAEKCLEPEVAVTCVVGSTEEAEAKESIIVRIEKRPTTVTMLTTKLATATGTCLTTAVTTTNTSPRSSTDSKMEEACVTMCQGPATTQQLVDLLDHPSTASTTSLHREDAIESLKPCDSHNEPLRSGLTPCHSYRALNSYWPSWHLMSKIKRIYLFFLI